MKNLKNRSFNIIRLDKNEFEIDTGDIFPMPFELDDDEELSVDEFQIIFNSSKELILNIIELSNE